MTEHKFIEIEVPNYSEEDIFWLEYNAVRRDLFGYLKRRFTEVNNAELSINLIETIEEISAGLIGVWEQIKSHYLSEERKLERLSGAFYEALFYHACLIETVILIESQQLIYEGRGENLPPGEVPYSATMPTFEVIPRLFWIEENGQSRRYAPQMRGDFVQFRRDKDDTVVISLIDVKRSKPSGKQLWETIASVLGGAVFELAYPKEGISIPLKLEDWEREIVCLQCGKWPIEDGICSNCGKKWI
jgi:hypothetical protein